MARTPLRVDVPEGLMPDARFPFQPGPHDCACALQVGMRPEGRGLWEGTCSRRPHQKMEPEGLDGAFAIFCLCELGIVPQFPI